MLTPFGRRLFVMTAVLIAMGSLANAQTPKPAKEDTAARRRSKNAAVSVAIVPAEAKRGETVKLIVTVKLDKGYHIFKYSKDKAEPGLPYPTNFDLFDPAGLEPIGDWTSSREPVKLPMPVFKQVPFVELFEGEVDFIRELKIPEGLEPGKKAILTQMDYQI